MPIRLLALRPIGVTLVCLACLGCAHDGHLSPRTVHAMVLAGTVVAVAGVLEATGCDNNGSPSSSCSARPGDGDVALGLATAAVGASAIGTALWLRPRDMAMPLGAPALPPPALPGPFQQPLGPSLPVVAR